MIDETRLIEIKGVSKSFGDTQVLHGIDLYIRKREFVTLLGPSGCGKTTLLRILGGFEMPDQGEVLFEGKDMTGAPPYKRRINTVFQKYALFNHLNVFDNIAFGLKVAKLPKAEIVAYGLTAHDYDNFFHTIDKSRLSRHSIDYDNEFIGQFLPKIKHLKKCLEQGRWP